MKRILASKLAFILLAVIMLATILTVPALDGGVSPAKASTLKFTNLSSPKSHAGTLFIDSTDLFVTADGSTPKNGVDSISASTIEALLNNSTNVELFTDSSTNGGDITITAPIVWSTASTLTIDSFHSISIDAPITINNFSQGGLNLITSDGGSGGTLVFNGGNINFASGSGNLTINGNLYTLISDLNGLTSINSNPSGYYALAKNIDTNGTVYTSSPIASIATPFTGVFEGLGNIIDKLSIAIPINPGSGPNTGLFSVMNGTVENLGLTNVNISGTYDIGALAGTNNGTISHSYVAGTTSALGVVGGLVGINDGKISQSYSCARVNNFVDSLLGGGSVAGAGGLVGQNGGTISDSYATGDVHFNYAASGGLVGQNGGPIVSSYASGKLIFDTNGVPVDNTSTPTIIAGGLVGLNGHGIGTITNSYAVGIVSASSAPSGSIFNLGGLVGVSAGGPITNSSALTPAQLQAGLPAGFDPTVWGYKTNVLGNNTGYPVLQWQILPSFAAGQPSAFKTYIDDVSQLVNDNPQLKADVIFTLSLALALVPGAGEVALVDASATRGTITLAETVVKEEGAGITWGEEVLPATKRGDLFQDAAIKATGIPENTTRLTEVIGSGKQITAVPDGLGKTIVEYKDWVKLYNSNQFRAYLANSIKTKRPIELIVSPLTKTISKPLEDLIRESKGTIQIFDPRTGLFTPWPGF